jgi:hypothetical protein
LELSEIILALYAVGVSTRKISHFLEGIYGAFYSPQSISRLIQVTEEEVKAWRERPLSEEYYAVFLDGTFLSIRRGKTAKEPVYMALGIKPDGRREILGFWLFGAEGESARNWEEVLKDLKRRGVQRVRIFITDDLPGLEEAIKKIFPEADWQLCVLHAVRDALNKARKKGPRSLGRGSQDDLPGRDPGGGRGSLAKPTKALRHVLSQDCGALGNQGLCSFGFPASSKARSPLPLHHKPTGAVGQGDKEADEGGGGILRGRCRRKASILGFNHLGEAWGARRLLGFVEIRMGIYHANWTH